MELTPYRDATERAMTRASFSDAATEHIGLEVWRVILHDLGTRQYDPEDWSCGDCCPSWHGWQCGACGTEVPQKWTLRDHFGMCEQCRANSSEPDGTCEVCDQFWILECICLILKAHVQTYGETTYGPRAEKIGDTVWVLELCAPLLHEALPTKRCVYRP